MRIEWDAHKHHSYHDMVKLPKNFELIDAFGWEIEEEIPTLSKKHKESVNKFECHPVFVIKAPGEEKQMNYKKLLEN
jgi:hypothetical protein